MSTISEIVDPVAEALFAVIEALPAPKGASKVRAHKWAPKVLPARPCGVIELPTLDRVDPDEPESQLGTNDWEMTFTVAFYADLGEPERCQIQILEVVEAFVAAIDADPSLGIAPADGPVEDCKVVHVGPAEILDDQPRALFLYPATVQLVRFVEP